MNQAEVAKLVSGLRVKLRPVLISSQKRTVLEGYRGQLTQLRETVSALVAHERVEVSQNKGFLTRMYTERLIQEAVEHGDTHKETMEVARWWLKDDATLVHKLFKVLVPRYEDHTMSYTRAMMAPYQRHDNPKVAPYKVLLELRGHPFPPLNYSNSVPNRNHLHNVLLNEARKDKRMKVVDQQTGGAPS